MLQNLKTMQASFLVILVAILEGIAPMTVITQPEINARLGKDRSIALNCTFSEGTLTSLLSMIWTKKSGNAYNDIARYERFPLHEVRLTENGSYLINRSQLISPGNGSNNSFILTINDTECQDDGEYQCVLNYIENSRPTELTGDTTVFLQVDAEKPANFTLYPNDTLRENDTLTLYCSANVGNPEGYVAIWKIYLPENDRVLLNQSNSVEEKNENCSTVAHLTVNYIVSKKDNGANFTCSSHNRQSKVQGPSRVVDIFYSPSYVKIDMWPTSSTVFVGSKVTLTCNSDGNPVPTFKWMFNSTNDRSEKVRQLPWKDRILVLNSVNLNDSGIYLCLASNSIYGEILNKSSNITLKVQERVHVTVNQTCRDIQCGITQSCMVKDHKAICIGNDWAYVAFTFISLTLIFGSTTAILYFRRKNDKTSINSNGDVKLSEHVQSQSNDYDFGGYSDPKDVTKLCPNPDKRDPENTAYADPVDSDQYASVKKTENTTNPPNVQILSII